MTRARDCASDPYAAGCALDERTERRLAEAIAASKRHSLVEQKSAVTAAAAATATSAASGTSESGATASAGTNADADDDAPAKSAAPRSALHSTGWHAGVATATIAVALAFMLLAL